MPDWASLPPEARRLYSRFMEVFAGFLSHTDHQVGRLIEFLRQQGELDNTLVMVISDNGASAEGGPTGTTNEAQFFNNAQEPLEDSLKLIDEIGGPKHFNHYPWGWTWAGNTPFRRWKRETYRGGASDPFIVSWPQGITARGEVRTQYAHIIDMVPTVLDLLGIEPPKAIRGVTQSPLHGVSFAHTLRRRRGREQSSHAVLRDAGSPGHLPRRLAGRLPLARAVVHRGGHALRAADLRPRRCPSWTPTAGSSTTWRRISPRTTTWPPSHRDRLIALIGTWYVEAGKYNVMPVDGSGLARMVAEKPLVALPRDSYTYRPGTQSIPFFAAPRVLNRPHAITADVEIPADGAEGVLLSQGTSAGGYSLFVKDGRLRYVHNYVGRAVYGVESDIVLAPGKHELRFEFEPTGQPDMEHGKGAPGRLQLYIDGTLTGNAEAPVTNPFVLNPGALTCGANPGSAITDDYPSPFKFTGTIHSVTVDVSGKLIDDPEAELRVHMARQ